MWWAKVILLLRVSLIGALMVTEIYTLGISAVVKENGDTTNRANNNMWDHNLFITSPVPIENTSLLRNKTIKNYSMY